MRVPLSWLKEFVDITISPAELAYRLTVAGVEVSKIEYVGVAPDEPNRFGVSEEAGLAWDRALIVVGRIVEVQAHPNADRLVLADVEYGEQEPHRVVTGAPNIFHLKGQGRLADGPKVVFAREGSQLYDGHAEGRKLMTLKPSKIRGIPSNAMVCSEKELGMSEEHEGIIILDADAPVGMPLADYMGDVVLHIEILPNIARCQSIIGVAREAAALSGAPFKGSEQGRLRSPGAALKVTGEAGWVRLRLEAPDLSPRYSLALIRDVHIGPSPEWMQRRLRLVGVRAISNIVDITNYVMMERGQPLHAFDYDKLVRRAAAGSATTGQGAAAEGVSPESIVQRPRAVSEPSATAGMQGAEGASPESIVQRPKASGAAPAGDVKHPRQDRGAGPADGQDSSGVLHPRAGDVKPPADGPHAASDRDRWLDDGGPAIGAPTAGDAIPPTPGVPPAESDVQTHADGPHAASDRDRWLDDGGPAIGAPTAGDVIPPTPGVPPAESDDKPPAEGQTRIENAGSAAEELEASSAESGQLPGTTPTIIVRRAREGEHMTTLDGVDRTLTAEMLMIADSGGSIGLAGVMGGLETEIDERTTRVLLEAAAFNFINNRKTASALKLPSEATARFGRGVPPAYSVPAIERACALMQALAQGEPAPEIVDAYPGRQAPTVIAFDTAEIKRLLGIDVPLERITAILKSLDFEVKHGKSERGAGRESTPAGKGDVIEITVPEHRLDVAIPADIVEEVARVIGYDQIPPTLMRDELPPQRHNLSLEAEDLVRDILVGCGLQEVISYPLTTVEREALLFPDPAQADLDPGAYVTIANPISPERKVMRQTLLSSLLDTLREALRHRERVLLFEIGRVYLPQAGSGAGQGTPESTLGQDAGEGKHPRQNRGAGPGGAQSGTQGGGQLPSERTRLTIALAGPREPQAWVRGKRTAPLDFFDIKGIVDTLLQRLHVEGAEFTPSEHPAFHPARSARLEAGASDERKIIGVLGEVHPEVREHFDLPHDPVCLAEFDLDALRAAMGSARFQKLPRFPALREDIAVVVDEEVAAAQVEAVIREAGGAMLRSTTLFDLYRGDQVGAGRKSLAYALTYQHDERTLTDDEAARIRGRIVKKLRDTIGAELRG